MQEFYTNVQTYGSRILYRGVKNGKKIKEKIDYHPTLFVSSPKSTKFKTLKGEYVSEITPGNIHDCRDFVEKYKDKLSKLKLKDLIDKNFDFSIDTKKLNKM